MTITALTSREFNQDTGRAKKAADHGPVFVTDRGRPAYVLMRIEDYRQLTGTGRRIADLLAMPGVEDVDLDIPALRDVARPADLA